AEAPACIIGARSEHATMVERRLKKVLSHLHPKLVRDFDAQQARIRSNRIRRVGDRAGSHHIHTHDRVVNRPHVKKKRVPADAHYDPNILVPGEAAEIRWNKRYRRPASTSRTACARPG